MCDHNRVHPDTAAGSASYRECNTSSLTNAYRPRNNRTPANENGTKVDVKHEPWSSSRDFARELGIPPVNGPLECFVMVDYSRNITAGARFSFQTIIYYSYNRANTYVNTLWIFYATFCRQKRGFTLQHGF